MTDRLAWAVFALAGGIVLANAGANPALAVPDRWGAAPFLALVPALLTVGVAPGLIATRGLGLRDAWGRLGGAIVLSALAGCACGALTLAAGRPLGDGVRVLAGLVVVLSLGLAIKSGTRSGAPPAAVGDHWGLVLIAGWVLVVVLVYAANPELRFRVDGWFHGAVTARVAQGGLPPEDPYFAGERLRYFWGYHVLLGWTTAAAPPGASVFGVLAGWCALAALSVSALLVALGRAWVRATGGAPTEARTVGAWVLVVALLAMNPLGWVFFAARGLIGNERGITLLAAPFDEGAVGVLSALSLHYPHISMASFADKFLTPTAFGLGEAALLAAGLTLLFDGGEGDRASVRRLALGALFVAAGLVLHTLAGIALVVALLAAALVLVLRRASRARGALALAALAVGVGIAAPYLAFVQGPARGAAAPRLGIHLDMWWALAMTGFVVVGLALVEAARRVPHAPEGSSRHGWFAAAAVLLGLAAFLVLVQRNETKFANLAFLACAVPAGAALARVRRNWSFALAAFLVPTNALAVAGFALDGGMDVPGQRAPRGALADAYDWIATHTARDAVFLEAQAANAHDPVRDVLVHGPRPLVWGGLGYASNWGYPEGALEWRQTAARELAQGTLSDPSCDALVRHLSPRPVYVVSRGTTDRAGTPAAHPSRLSLEFANPALRVYALAPAVEAAR